MAPSHDDHQETQPPATPPASSGYPPGYRFVPTDCELIREYLQKKVNNEPIPISDIKDTYLRLKSPMDLAAELPKIGENEWYFFTPRDRKYPNGKRPDRAAGSGYWKATGNDKEVANEESIIGFRRSLVFYQGKPMRGEKTNWIMHEFTLNQTPRQKTTTRDMRLDDWVLCRIHKKSPKKVRAKKRKARTDEEGGVGTVGVGVGVCVTTNNLNHRDHHDHSTTSVQYYCYDDQQHEQPNIHDHVNNSNTAPGQYYSYQPHEQQPIQDHVNNSNTAPAQFYSYYQQHEQQQPIHDHVNYSNTAPGQYYSYQQHEQQQPIHHHVNNNTGSGSGFGYGDWYRKDDGLDLASSHVNNAYLNEQAAVTGFHEAWNNEAFLPSYNANNTMANSNSNASCNNESAAAFFPANDPCPAPANINNNSANYGGGKKRSIY